MKSHTTKLATCALLAASGTFLGTSDLLGQGSAQSASTTQIQMLKPWIAPAKSATILVSATARQNILAVKFKQNRKMRAYGGRVYDMGTATVASVTDFTLLQPTLARLVALNAYWYPLHNKSTEAQLDALRSLAEANTGAETPDLNATMLVTVPVGINAQDMANQINSVDEVEYVEPVMVPVAFAPDLSSKQDYVHGPNAVSTRFGGYQAGGINAEYVWNTFNNRGVTTGGTKIKVAVVENACNLSHIELAGIILAGGTSTNASTDIEHGTATASIIKGQADGVGLNGIANQCKLYIALTGPDKGDPVADALNLAYHSVGQGGIISVSLGYSIAAADSPDHTHVVQLPITYSQNIWQLVYSINQAGCICVLAAGNTGVMLDNYDAPLPHHPFTSAGSISGLIYAGAGAVAPSGQVARSRCQFNQTQSSNYGTYVSLQGWGHYVEAAGMENNYVNYTGGTYIAEGDNSAYTEGFAGTSAATPIVAGAAALLQSVSLQQSGVYLTPNQLKKKMKQTGLAQQDGNGPGYFPATQKIGKQPNLKDATFYLLPQASQQATTPQPSPDEEAYTPAYNYPPYPPYGQEPP